MYLKSLSMKGFKSFPERTRMSFVPGVSVIVGPNGCGKSNITDAVLWALGEQSPAAIRGNTMQDVIFSGGKGSSPRRFAEVEVVIDNSEGRAVSEFSEISVSRRVDRSGQSEYRLNGARCRLADILEALADTNLGHEMHSVISQGRVEAIVNSKPRDRRRLVEEAAGLGKHRKRRHRAALKLDRTRDNLDRANDIEREARSRLRPLKAQAEAAERTARLQTQEDELRAELVADDLRAATERFGAAESGAGEARSVREGIEERLAEVAKRRAAIEERIASGERERRTQAERLVEARTALDRARVRAESLTLARRELAGGLGERQLRLVELDERPGKEAAEKRIADLEQSLASLEGSEDAAEQVAAAERARTAAREAADKAARLRADLAGELDAVEARLAAALGEDGESLLAGLIQAAPGLEQALSAALGERLRAAVVSSFEEGSERIAASEGAARTLISGRGAAASSEPPSEDARRLLDLVEADERAREVAERLLADAWLVEELDSLPEDFSGIAVTIDGDCFDGAAGELLRVPRAATDPALLLRSRREELLLRLKQREQTEERAKLDLERTEREFAEARTTQGEAEAHPDEVRRAQIKTELTVERRHAESAEAEAETRQIQRDRLDQRISTERELIPILERSAAALTLVGERLRATVEGLEAAAGGSEGAGAEIAAELRECSQAEYGLQAELRSASERSTATEVESAQLRSARDEAAAELREIGGRLGTELVAATGPLSDEAREEIDTKLERLIRRREAVGPVNPLAESEYAEAKEHADGLKQQRQDLERGLRELQSLIRRTDREIAAAFEETFAATAANFEEMVAELFPGGTGELRKIETKPAAAAGAEAAEGAEGSDSEESDEEEDEDAVQPPTDWGVEISVTPAGKSKRNLSLLSGGEKSLVALAFVFAVLLARPCPFYILDEVEAALDDINLDRFLRLVRRFSNRSQFIVVTHQKRTMDAADVLYGVSMGADGITKVVSRKLAHEEESQIPPEPEGDEPVVRAMKAA